MTESIFSPFEIAVLDKYRDRISMPSSGTVQIALPLFREQKRCLPPIYGEVRRLYEKVDCGEYDEHEHLFEYRVYVGGNMVLYDHTDDATPELLDGLMEECISAVDGVFEYLDGRDEDTAFDKMNIPAHCREMFKQLADKALQQAPVSRPDFG